MIKVFTTMDDASRAGISLTDMIGEWQKEVGDIKITNIHSNSNKFGWMVIIQYEWDTNED